MAITITYRRTIQGAWELTAVVDGYLVHHQYTGYTKRESTAMFRELVRVKTGRARKAGR